MNYLSVASGIEAASVAWHPLGWTPVAFSEIEPFPCSVLKHHYPHVPNLGDMTKFHEWPDLTIDLLCGGTPCQAFSVAGLRQGLADPRGNLTLTFLAIAARYMPEWIVWENVPGVLSDRTNAFGKFLAGLAQLGYGWAYRVLDAQYFGLAQRRRRVFVVAHLGDWRRAAEVLFESESLRWDHPPSRETGKEAAGTLSARTKGGGGPGTDFDIAGGLQACNGGADENDARDGRLVAEHGCGVLAREVAHRLCAHMTKGGDPTTDNYVAHTLRGIGVDASEDGTGRGTPLVAFSCKDHGSNAGPVSPTLRSMGHSKSHANGGGQVAVAFHPTQDPIFSENGTTHALACGSKGGQASIAVAFQTSQSGTRIGDVHATLDSNNGSRRHNGVLSFHENQRAEVSLNHTVGALDKGGGKPGQGYPAILSRPSVRRLTPLECERLQGFPDLWTDVPHNGKPAKDGPRYKALGNSMAVPCMRWISRRIQVAAETYAPVEV